MSISSSFPSIAPSLTLDFAKSRRLDPRITFTRAQTGNIATYVGADGLIKYAGPNQPRFDHKQTFRTNLLTYSEQMDQKGQVFVNVTTNAIIAPDGSLTADLIQETTSNGQHNIQQGAATVVGGSHTVSVYAKAYSSNRVLRIATYKAGNPTGTDTVYLFNLNTGVATKVVGVSGGMEHVGDGWYRCYVTTGNINAGTGVFFGIAETNGVYSYTGDGSSGFYLWGGQLETGSIMTDYIATGPNPVTRTATESLGLLVEEQRINYAPYSSDYTTLTNFVEATSTSNTTISPDGTLSADTITANSGNQQHGGAKNTTSLPINSVCCLSVFVKAGTNNFCRVDSANVTNWSPNAGVAVDLRDGSIIAGSGTVIPYGNGWYRICIFPTSNSTASATRGMWVWVANSSGSSTWNTAGTETIHVWGAQMEVGAFPTSYIPTISSTAVTRPGDKTTIELDKTAALYNNDEGTFFSESVGNCTLPANNYGGVFGVGSSTAITNFFYFNPSNTTGYYASNITQVPSMSIGKTYVNGQRYSLAGGYSNSGFSLSKDGDITSNTSTGILNGTDVRFAIGANVINQASFGTQVIRKVSYYPKKLTNAQLQTLTK